MSATTIEWTQHSWNPIVGCTIVSPGCTNCYAMKQAGRLLDHPRSHYSGTTKRVNGNTVWTGKVAMAPDSILHAPLIRKKPTTWFVNSMGDLFHEDVPDEWIDRVFAIMALCPRHRFQVLTKRPKRMREYLTDASAYRRVLRAADPLRQRRPALGSIPISDPQHQAFWPQVWLGVSAEDQARADERIPELLKTPAAVRFVSLEPLLGPIDIHRWALGYGGGEVARCENCGHGHGFTRCQNTGFIANIAQRNGVQCTAFRRKSGWGGLDWIIVGGESGPNARPMHPDWTRAIRDRCKAAHIPFFFKQWGEIAPYDRGRVDSQSLATPSSLDHPMQRFGKKLAGRMLDGREHDGMPSGTCQESQ